MKKIKYLILILGILGMSIFPSPASAYSLIYQSHTPATHNYTGFCNGNYHGLSYCEFTDPFLFKEDQIVNAVTMYDLGCNSRDQVEMFLSYAIVNAATHTVVAETLHNRHVVCTPSYSPQHNVPTILEVDPVRLLANQSYYIMLRASNNEQARAYWGVSAFNRDSFQIHGSPVLKRPVIFLPGIMGSTLKRVSNGSEVWPNVNEMVFSGNDSYLDDLKLTTNGSQRTGKELEPANVLERVSFSVFGQDVVTQNFYGDLIKSFTDRGYVRNKDLFAFAYDWRSDLRTQTSRLHAVVEAARSASPDGKVNLVAHSMGGLLAKQYLSMPENAALVDSVVLIGTPQLGAPSMFKALNYGDNLGFKFPVVNVDLLNSNKIKEISQNMPGAYELLPSKEYVSKVGGYIKDFRGGKAQDLSFEEIQALMTSNQANSRNPLLLKEGQEFHDFLDIRPILGPRVYNITACGNLATIGQIRLYDDGKIDIGGVDGDGTVPLLSALHQSDAYTNYFVASQTTGINHSRLVRDSRTMDLIERLAEGSDPVVAPGIATNPEICSSVPTVESKRIRFSSYSPEPIHVYDSSGRHTGPTEDGDLELGIPDSSYEIFGNNSFVFVPSGDDYRIAMRTEEDGMFSLKAEVSEGLNIFASTNYLDVPLAGSSSAIEATFSEDNLTPDLSLDENGDGAMDQIILPTAFLSGPTTSDTEPPIITHSGIPTGTVAAGIPITISFSADDSISGVATLSATLDGVPFVSGATLPTLSAGPHLIAIRSSDKAGNPRVLIQEFVQAAATTTNEPNPSQPSSGESSTDGQGSGSQSSGNRKGGKRNSSSSTKGNVLGVATSTQIQSQDAATFSNSAVPSAQASTCLAAPSGSLGREKINDRNQVASLQTFLSKELKANIPSTGFFGPITELAVKVFQLKYYTDILAPSGLKAPTGFVGKYTLNKIGQLACATPMQP